MKSEYASEVKQAGSCPRLCIELVPLLHKIHLRGRERAQSPQPTSLGMTCRPFSPSRHHWDSDSPWNTRQHSHPHSEEHDHKVGLHLRMGDATGWHLLLLRIPQGHAHDLSTCSVRIHSQNIGSGFWFWVFFPQFWQWINSGNTHLTSGREEFPRMLVSTALSEIDANYTKNTAIYT